MAESFHERDREIEAIHGAGGLNDVPDEVIMPVDTKSKSRIVDPRAVTASAIPSRSPDTSVNLGVAAERLTKTRVQRERTGQLFASDGRVRPEGSVGVVSIRRWRIADSIAACFACP